jgi:hypothetical protein
MYLSIHLSVYVCTGQLLSKLEDDKDAADDYGIYLTIYLIIYLSN